MNKKTALIVLSILLALLYCYPVLAADTAKLTWLVPSKSKYLVEAEQGLIDAYQKKHPNVKIELKTSTWATYNTTLLPLISSGNIPDLMYHVETKPWSLYSMIGKDSILPVDDLMDEFKDDLPENARNYLNKVAELCETPIDIVSTGPDREETIVVRHPFEA